MDWFNNILGFLGRTDVNMGLQAVSGFMQYRQEKAADKASAKAAMAQGAIMESDAARAAQEELSVADKARKQQISSFLKSGVDLTGSPLLVMEETRQKGIENARNVVSGTKARADLVRAQGSVKRASLVNTALDVGKGIYGTSIQSQLLKKVTG